MLCFKDHAYKNLGTRYESIRRSVGSKDGTQMQSAAFTYFSKHIILDLDFIVVLG